MSLLYYPLLGAPLLAFLVLYAVRADDESPWGVLVIFAYLVNLFAVDRLWGTTVALYVFAGAMVASAVISWVDGVICRRRYGRNYELY